MLKELAKGSREAARVLAAADTALKNAALLACADALEANAGTILAANAEDVAAARAAGTKESMIDRLALDKKRIEGMAKGLREVAALPDPCGTTVWAERRPNGLDISCVRVPIGVIGMIYEARPNVTADAAALCLKSGNACILRGGREALRSNTAISEVIRSAIEEAGLPRDCVSLLADTTREGAEAMMKARGIIDLLIPRGGAGLIRSVVENARVPVIETGVGNCHIYIEKTADPETAVAVTYNAKTSRVSVCNAAESLLIDRDCAEKLLPLIKAELDKKEVVLYGCEETRAILGKDVLPATQEDYAREYLDYAMSVKVVSGIDEAIAHIAEYSTGHSEAIITQSYGASERFMREVDASAVYVNASTRFTDGGEFGLGAEIGISTQKMHVRGPMGLTALTSMKYTVRGNGQIR
ncbi:MAG: glutamate-5-semialdehyde dehydrogenase [Clostridia bacterium]|nr:glutamate-5-semialdehyde dehydrogenase [Clostridia bacterium]